MGFSCCLVLLSHLTYKVALILAATRLVVYWVLRYMGSHGRRLFYIIPHCRSSSSSSLDPSSSGAAHEPQTDDDQMMMNREEYCSQLDDDDVTIYDEDLAPNGRLQLESCETCAVCLNELRDKDKVRELRNCCHVFHRSCINRWLDHNDQKTCPLCRTPLLLSLSIPRSRSSCCLGESPTTMNKSGPSWAVEQLLYLFGDDLL
ncbi:zinc finger protein [Macleaya cordata]|uniref:Zinc finger protein n=1 Tax=Macleaya cordata TaxID=56857 RepID=A0A200PN05_MACCD|nr:zinc finger protein [Macleaya cordata]